MARLDDLIEELRSDGREDDAQELERLSGSQLRQKAQKTDQLEKELEQLKAENAGLKRGPAARKAFEDYGVDLSGLSKAERKVIESYDGELTEDEIGKLVEEYDLPVVASSEENDGEEQPAAQRVAQAARSSESGRGKTVPTVSPADVAGWPMEKKLGFADKNPDAWEALKRGESVTGVSA
jgi:hypothetical protein